jgi:myo-inositol catabolism protein IolC
LDRLYVLPCDHRDILRAYWDKARPPGFVDGDQWVTYAKQVVLDGLLLAVEAGVEKDHCALLMDEELGAPVLQRARDYGVRRFVPTDDGTVGDYVLQYGPEFPRHIQAIDPDFVQTLINYNPESSAAEAQLQRIGPLFDYLGTVSRRFMLELQVLPTAEQIAGEGISAWIETKRPALIRQAILDLQQRGAEPDVWKLEPMPNADEYSRAISSIKAGGRDHAVAVVLGGGATTAAVDESLKSSAVVDGFVGFAVGRSVWAEGIENLSQGSWDGQKAAQSVADKFRHFVEVFDGAKSQSK